MITQPAKKESPKSTSYVTSGKLLSCLTSPLYILHVLWFAFLQLRLVFFVGVLNRWLSALAEGDLDDGLVLIFLSRIAHSLVTVSDNLLCLMTHNSPALLVGGLKPR